MHICENIIKGITNSAEKKRPEKKGQDIAKNQIGSKSQKITTPAAASQLPPDGDGMFSPLDKVSITAPTGTAQSPTRPALNTHRPSVENLDSIQSPSDIK